MKTTIILNNYGEYPFLRTILVVVWALSAIMVHGQTLVRQNNSPVVKNPVPDQIAHIEQQFSFTFADTTFEDSDESDVLLYSAHVIGEAGLPTWLDFDSALRTFSGMPSETDEGTFSVELIARDISLTESRDTFDITVKGAIKKEAIEDPLCRIYPNPATGILYIYLDNIYLQTAEIRVLDAMGRLVYYQNNLESEQLMLDLTDQPIGLYFVKINSIDTDLSFRIFLK